jgi:hypothetical protein
MSFRRTATFRTLGRRLGPSRLLPHCAFLGVRTKRRKARKSSQRGSSRPGLESAASVCSCLSKHGASHRKNLDTPSLKGLTSASDCSQSLAYGKRGRSAIVRRQALARAGVCWLVEFVGGDEWEPVIQHRCSKNRDGVFPGEGPLEFDLQNRNTLRLRPKRESGENCGRLGNRSQPWRESPDDSECCRRSDFV